MVVGSAHTRVLVRDWGRAEAPRGRASAREPATRTTNAFEAVRRDAAKKRPSIFRSRFNTTRAAFDETYYREHVTVIGTNRADCKR